jgi:hypothetical protein
MVMTIKGHVQLLSWGIGPNPALKTGRSARYGNKDTIRTPATNVKNSQRKADKLSGKNW